MASQLASVSPNPVSQGAELTLQGADSAGVDNQGTVTIGGMSAQVTSWQSVKTDSEPFPGFHVWIWLTTIKAIVPQCGTGSKSVKYTPQGEAASNSMSVNVQ